MSEVSELRSKINDEFFQMVKNMASILIWRKVELPIPLHKRVDGEIIAFNSISDFRIVTSDGDPYIESLQGGYPEACPKVYWEDIPLEDIEVIVNAVRLEKLFTKMTHHISNIVVNRVKDFLRDLVDDQPQLNIRQTEDIIQSIAEEVDESYRRKLCEDKFQAWFCSRPCEQYTEKIDPFNILFDDSIQELTPAQHGYCCNAVEQSLNFEKIANNFVTRVNLLGDIDYVWITE